MAAYRIEAVGRVRGGRDAAVDDDWGSSRARIELDPPGFTPEAFAGLAEFSHAEIVLLVRRAAALPAGNWGQLPNSAHAWRGAQPAEGIR
jgi:tRNA (Thr-GGU) A37 N-methylase